MERIRKPLHYILVVYTRVLYGRSFIDLVHLPLDLRRVGPQMNLAHKSYGVNNP